MHRHRVMGAAPLLCLAGMLVGALCAASPAPAMDAASEGFSDVPSRQAVEHPAWFKKSLLDLREDLAEAAGAGKAGLVVYFGQAHCPYCRQLLEGSLARSDLEAYARDHFDFVGLDIFSNDEVVTPDGATLEVGEFAVREEARLTPSLLFYTAGGHQALKLRGYYPPYKLRAALEYVAGGHFVGLTLREYLELADPPPRFEPDDLTVDPLFSPPPHALDRSLLAAQRPLLVMFEQGDCHPCDVLHSGPLRDPSVRALLERFDVVQLHLQDDRTPVITPDGIRLTPRAWAEQLGVFYAPALFFYDERGWEVFRLDSVAHLHRLRGALEYVLEKGYLVEPLFQRWRRQH